MCAEKLVSFLIGEIKWPVKMEKVQDFKYTGIILILLSYIIFTG